MTLLGQSAEVIARPHSSLVAFFAEFDCSKYPDRVDGGGFVCAKNGTIVIENSGGRDRYFL